MNRTRHTALVDRRSHGCRDQNALIGAILSLITFAIRLANEIVKKKSRRPFRSWPGGARSGASLVPGIVVAGAVVDVVTSAGAIEQELGHMLLAPRQKGGISDVNA